jgi:hypothetical protein
MGRSYMFRLPQHIHHQVVLNHKKSIIFIIYIKSMALQKKLRIYLFRIEYQLIRVYKRDALCLLRDTK